MILPLFTILASSCTSDPAVRASPGDCVDLGLWSNDFHTDLAIPATALAADHPIRKLFPEARHFLVGWGERDYFMDPDPGPWDALAAIIPPSPSTVHVIAHDEPVSETVWRPVEYVEFSVSRAGAERLATSIVETLETGGDGGPIVLGEGEVAGSSVFLEARPHFHLFHMCNHWTAGRLRDAGAPVHPWRMFTAAGLVDAVRDKAAPVCPLADSGVD